MLVLAAVLLLCVYSWFNMNWWQQELRQKLKHLTIDSTSDNNKQQASLVISKIELPQAPKQTVAVKEVVQAAENNSLKEQQNLAPSPTKIITPLTEKPAVKVQPQAVKEPKQEQSAEQIYEQLQGDNTLDVQIALPTNPTKQQRLFDYLYRCAGVQFAILQQQQLSYLSPQRYVPVSQWLRVANGPLSTQEQQWLGQQNGTPIRLFPQAIDQRLAQYIATNLGGSKLSSFRASYELTASGLVLTNIQVNEHKTQGTWLLHRSQCTA